LQYAFRTEQTPVSVTALIQYLTLMLERRKCAAMAAPSRGVHRREHGVGFDRETPAEQLPLHFWCIHCTIFVNSRMTVTMELLAWHYQLQEIC